MPSCSDRQRLCPRYNLCLTDAFGAPVAKPARPSLRRVTETPRAGLCPAERPLSAKSGHWPAIPKQSRYGPHLAAKRLSHGFSPSMSSGSSAMSAAMLAFPTAADHCKTPFSYHLSNAATSQQATTRQALSGSSQLDRKHLPPIRPKLGTDIERPRCTGPVLGPVHVSLQRDHLSQ